MEQPEPELSQADATSLRSALLPEGAMTPSATTQGEPESESHTLIRESPSQERVRPPTEDEPRARRQRLDISSLDGHRPSSTARWRREGDGGWNAAASGPTTLVDEGGALGSTPTFSYQEAQAEA